jgi:hypothetical protein
MISTQHIPSRGKTAEDSHMTSGNQDGSGGGGADVTTSSPPPGDGREETRQAALTELQRQFVRGFLRGPLAIIEGQLQYYRDSLKLPLAEKLIPAEKRRAVDFGIEDVMQRVAKIAKII